MRVWFVLMASAVSTAQPSTLTSAMMESVPPAGYTPSMLRPGLNPPAPVFVDVPAVPKSEEVSGQVHQVRFSPDDVLAAARQARHPQVATIFRFEIGGFGYDPYVQHSDHRCFGPGGLCSYGLLPDFRNRGYQDPHNPYAVAEYIDGVLDRGGYRNWPYL